MKALAAWLALAGAGIAAQGVPPPAADGAALAERLLGLHERQQRGMRALTADFRQRRTSELLAEPLVSEGTFLFVRTPGCVVFRTTKPRPSVVRLTAGVYEVLRPAQRHLERFRLDGPELADSLFAALAGDVAALRREFEFSGCEAEPERPERVRLRFAPGSARLRARLGELVLTLRATDGGLCAVAYRDRTGDLVEIELTAIRRDPDELPSADLEIPPGTRVIEHAGRRPPG